MPCRTHARSADPLITRHASRRCDHHSRVIPCICQHTAQELRTEALVISAAGTAQLLRLASRSQPPKDPTKVPSKVMIAPLYRAWIQARQRRRVCEPICEHRACSGAQQAHLYTFLIHQLVQAVNKTFVPLHYWRTEPLLCRLLSSAGCQWLIARSQGYDRLFLLRQMPVCCPEKWRFFSCERRVRGRCGSDWLVVSLRRPRRLLRVLVRLLSGRGTVFWPYFVFLLVLDCEARSGKRL